MRIVTPTPPPTPTRLLSLVSRISLSSVGHCASFESQTLLSLADIPPLLLFLLGYSMLSDPFPLVNQTSAANQGRHLAEIRKCSGSY